MLERLRVDGPLSALDFERQHGETVDWFGVKTNVVRAVLEAYTVTGVLGLARRDGNRRYYDLIERLLPKKVLAREVPLHDQLRHKMLSRYRAHGLLGASSGGDVFGGLGPAKPDPRFPEYPGRTALREQLIEDGELVPVEVDGTRGKRFVVRDEVELLAAPPEPPPSVAFLSPFDPLVWDRALLGSLFEFDYVWDLFHPPEKRRFGYYVLPIVFRDRFVGRIEPQIDRSGGPVQVLGLWWEDGFTPRRAEGFVDAMRSVTGSVESARDVVQEAFAQALRDQDGFRGEGSLEGWVWRIAFRVAVGSKGSRELAAGRGARGGVRRRERRSSARSRGARTAAAAAAGDLPALLRGSVVRRDRRGARDRRKERSPRPCPRRTSSLAPSFRLTR